MTFVITNVYWENTESYLRKMKELHPDNKAGAKRMYAFGTPGPMLITQSVEQIRDQVNGSFAYAKQYDIPVFFQLDDTTNYTTSFGDGAEIKYYEHPRNVRMDAVPRRGGDVRGGKRLRPAPEMVF